MIDEKMIEEVKKRLIDTYNPLEIYLFGSYAWGKPDQDSDLDLLIVVDHYAVDHYRDLVKGHKALGDLPIFKDLLLYDKAYFEEALKDKHSFCFTIKNRGKKIYAKA